MSRVSERMRYESTNNRIDTVRNMVDSAQETAVSGRKLHKISDNPVSAVRVFRNRAGLESINQFRKTLEYGRGVLGKSEDALRSINDALMRARELAVQQSNTTWSAENRKTVSKEIKQLISHVSVLGNSTFGDRYIFGGFQTHHPPIADDGSYIGDDGVLFSQVDENSFRPINISGREIFDVPQEEEGKTLPLIPALRLLHDSLENSNLNGIHESLSQLDNASNRIIDALAVVGARRSNIDDVGARLEFAEERFLANNNELEGADQIKTSLDLHRADSLLQYTLTSTGKMLTPSLMNFLQ